MSYFVTGNPAYASTAALATDPSTSAVLAKLDSTNFNSTARDRQYVVYAYCGGSTGAVWALERATSPNINSTSIIERITLFTASGQTSQFVAKFSLSGHEEVRVHHISSVTGSFAASLRAEEVV